MIKHYIPIAADESIGSVSPMKIIDVSSKMALHNSKNWSELITEKNRGTYQNKSSISI